MKKKLRRKIKDFFSIGNYIYADLHGRITVIIPPGTRLTDDKIAQDLNTLIIQYGVEAANFFLDYCSKYLNPKR